ncbi:putative RNA helicase [Helianthus annuus]|uniref:Putative helicase-associated domain-containing protein n=1 Tax=Helianthus annuus TaxID=4232 RepID=A0A251VF92_HELAN|nr:putative RNA helicase [Helianthus annuus]KAJ0951432.1 putative RNA helicase [Helianthus annuus]
MTIMTFLAVESLQDALKQLFLIDAIDENGTITRIGKTMSELPLEPSLARTLIEENKYDCLTQAITGKNGLSVVVIIEAEDLVKLSEPCDLDKSFAISQSIQDDEVEGGLIALYGNIKKAVEVNSSNKNITLIIDDISLLEVAANGSTKDILNLMHYYHTLTTQFGCTIITILHENIYSSEDGFTFPLQMEYLADITINRAFDNRVGSRCSRAGLGEWRW